MKDKKKHHQNKNQLTRDEIACGVNTFTLPDAPRAVLETKEGKNNGAKPAAFGGQQTYHT